MIRVRHAGSSYLSEGPVKIEYEILEEQPPVLVHDRQLGCDKWLGKPGAIIYLGHPVVAEFLRFCPFCGALVKEGWLDG